MADKQIIAASLSIDTGNSNSNIKEVNKNLNDVRSSLADTGATSTKTGKDIEGASGSFGKLKGQLSSLPGPLGAAGESVGKLNSSFKALLANPVGLIILAIVAALALLYKAFTNSFEGGQKMEQVFAGIKAAGQALIDNITNIAGAIVKLFKFDFSGAIKQIKGVAAEAGAAFTAMAKLTEKSQELRRAQLENDLDAAKRAKDLAILREQATDTDVPVKKRIELIKQLQDASRENAEQDTKAAKDFAENEIAKLTIQKDGARKNAEEITQLKINQIKVDTENANELRSIGKLLTTAEKQEASERKQLQDEQNARRKENLQKARENAEALKKIAEERIKQERATAKARAEGQAEELAAQIEYGKQLAAEQAKIDAAELKRIADNETNRLIARKKVAELNALNNPDDIAFKIAKIDADLQLELSKLAEGDLQKQILAKKASDEIVKINEAEAAAKRQIEELSTAHKKAQLNEVGQAVQNLSSLVGKETIAGKAIGIATALINTYQGASEALKQKSTLPSPFDVVAKVVNVATIIATGLKTVKAIASVQVPGGGGGGGATSAPSITPSAPIAPVQSSTSLDQASLSGIGNAAVRPFRSYVVSSDITQDANRNERLNRAARLG